MLPIHSKGRMSLQRSTKVQLDAPIGGAIKIEYENIEFENGEIEKQSGELKATP